MAISYYLSNLASNLAGGVRYSNRLIDTPDTAASITIPVTNGATEDSFGYTDAGVPSTLPTGTGNYTVLVNVTTGTTDIFCQIGLTRVNSAGVAQTNSAFTAEQGMTAGQKTFSLTAISLGTWATGDRLRVNYRFRSNRAHGGPSQILIEANTVNAEVATPFQNIVSGLINISMSNNTADSNILFIITQLLLDKNVQNEEIGGLSLSDLINIASNTTLSTSELLQLISAISLSKELSNTSTLELFIQALADLNINIIDLITGISGNIQKVYINTTANDTGRAEHPFVSWTDTEIVLDVISKQGLVGDSFYFKVLSTEGLESNWYGPVTITEAFISGVIYLSLSNSIVTNRYSIVNALTQLSKTMEINTFNTLVSTVFIVLAKHLTDQELTQIILLLLVSLQSTLDVDTLSSLANNIVLNLTSSLNIDATSLLITNLILLIVKETTISNSSTYITNLLVSLSSSLDINIFTQLINLVLVQIHNQLALDKSATLIAQIALSLYNELSFTFFSEIFGSIVIYLFNNYSINNAVNAIFGVLVLLNKELTNEDFASLISNIIVTMSAETDISSSSSAVFTKLIQLHKAGSIVITQTTLQAIFASMILSKSISIENIAFAIFSNSLVLEEILTVESYNNLILNLLTTIYSTYQDNTSGNIILQVYTELAKHVNTQYAVSSAISAYLILHKDTNIVVNREYIANAISSLSINISNNVLLRALLNISVILSNHYNTDLQELSSGLRAILGITHNFDMTSQSLASYLLRLSLENILSDAYITSKVLQASTIQDLHITSFTGVLSGLRGALSLNASTAISVSSSRTLVAIMQLLKSIDSSIYNINNIYNSNINVTLLTTDELRKTLESLSSLSIVSSYSSLAELISGITDSITLSSSIDNIVMSNITMQGILELSKNTVIQLYNLGIIGSDISLTKAVSLHLLTSLIQEVGIDISNIFVIENSFGFDITVETPDKRIYVIHFENRELKVTRSDREADIYSSNRKSDI